MRLQMLRNFCPKVKIVKIGFLATNKPHVYSSLGNLHSHRYSHELETCEKSQELRGEVPKISADMAARFG